MNSIQAHQLLLYLNTTSCHEDTKQFSLNSYLIFLPNLSFLVTNCNQRLCLSQKINLLKCSRSPKFFERADIIFIFSILPQEVVKKFFFWMSLLITICNIGTGLCNKVIKLPSVVKQLKQYDLSKKPFIVTCL